MGKKLALLSGAAVLAVLSGIPDAYAAKTRVETSAHPADEIQVRFDPQARQTRVAGSVGSDQCFAFALPQEWHSMTGGLDTRLKSTLSDAELQVSLRSSHELRGLPQPDLTSRDAALLQQDYENLLGRPAQSVSLASLSPGASRWSATWIDANLPGGPMTVEAFIVPLSEDWVLELSFSHLNAEGEYNALSRSLLTGLSVHEGGRCAGHAAFRTDRATE
ncbi:hypothetical protein [Microvirga sp. TS319]|uniref:hypothetical protein n=1 Tax=Microvirga sp. TS319 TaxID=3241165 RepID=UPI003519EF4C